MNTLLITIRFALVGVFVLAAIGKILDREGSRRALKEFGVPSALVPTAAVVLPIAELASAGLLVPGVTATAGAALAAALLLTFTAGIVSALRRGETPDCHCFGQIHSEPVGGVTLVRNGILLALAVLVLVAGPGRSPAEWVRTTSASAVALGFVSLLAAALAYACLSLWDEKRRLLRGGQAPTPMPVLEVGAPAPTFEAQDLAGKPVAAADLLATGRNAILVFTSATCGPCVQLIPELAQWRRMLGERLHIHVLAAGDESENRRMAAGHEMEMLLDPESSIARAFAISATPTAIEVDARGRVASPPVAGAPAIEAVIRAALKRPSAEEALQVTRVPAPTAVSRGPSSA